MTAEISGLWNRFVFDFMLGLMRALNAVQPLPAAPADLRPSSVVMFSTAGIGDTLSDTPAIRAVKERFPAAKVAVVVHGRRAAVLENNPHIDTLIAYRKGPLAFFSTLQKIRALSPDAAVVLRANDPDIRPLAYLSGAKAVLGRAEGSPFAFLFNAPVSVPDWEDLPGVVQTLRITSRLGASMEHTEIVYRVRDAERAEMKQRIGSDMPAVAVQIHHSPRLSFRDWPEDHFVKLLRMILNEFPVRVILTGGSGDVEKARRIESGVAATVGSSSAARVVNLAGQLSLRQAAALIEHSAIFVTTDTGLMHLGFAVKTPTLALLHPYNAHRVGPHGAGNLHHVVLAPGEARAGSGALRPLSVLPPESVFEAFRKHFRSGRP